MPRATSRLRELRKEAGWSQIELAERAVVARNVVYNSEKGNEVKIESLELIAGALEIHVDEILDHQKRDAVAEGPFKFHRYVERKIVPTPEAFCRDQRDATEAVVHMRDAWKTHIASCRQDEDAPEYEHGYQALLEVDFTHYQQRYVDLWRRNRQVMLFGVRDGTRCGMSVILPVSDSAYEQIRDGKKTFLEIEPDDLCDRSQNLIIDSGVEFESNLRIPWYSLTEPLRFAVFYQIAALSHDAGADDFRLVSFGASSLNSKRLAANGFRRTEVMMPEFGWPIYEFAKRERDEAELGRSTFAHYVAQMQHALTQEVGLRIRQHLLRRSVRIYQRLLSRYAVMDQWAA